MSDFNKKVEDLFADLDLSSDEELARETHREKVRQAKLAYYNTPAAETQRNAVKEKFKDKEWLAVRNERIREEHGVPSKFISPTGEEFIFRSGGEANEHFGENVAIHIPLSGAKRIERKHLKNWIVVRLDNSATPQEIAKLKEEIKLRINPPKKERDVEAWKQKMEDWRNSEEGKKYKETRKAVAKAMGKKNARPIMTPDGRFDSQADAARFYGITTGTMAGRMRDHSDKYYKIDEHGNKL